MYSVFDHGAMIADQVRMEAYRRVLKQTITPQSCVVDIGTGSGILALMAAKLGARRVYAIELDDVIGLARRLILEHGLGDRITLIQADVREVTLEEPADVIVSDIGGHLPWYGCHLSAVNHARSRLLAARGVMIPAVDRISAAVVSCSNMAWRRLWQQSLHGLNVSAAAEAAASEVRGHRFEPDDLLSDPVPVATLDYRAARETDLEQQISFDIIRRGAACGVALWVDRDLSDAICIENSPRAMASQNAAPVYRQLLFPWPKDVDVIKGDSVRLSLQARFSGADYDWSWDSLIRKLAGGNIQGIRFKQSTAPPAENGAGTSPVKLSEEGKALRLCLSMMQAGADNEAIADALMRGFPQRYPRRDTALAQVAALCREYA